MSETYEQRRLRLEQSAEAQFETVKRLQRLGLVCCDGDFVPSVHYPPITQYPLAHEDDILGTYTVPDDGMMDIYVHIPFCIQHCLFCHYPGLVGDRSAEKEKYITHLLREMDIYLERLGLDKFKPRSILMGGGTPTSLSPELLERFVTGFAERVDFSACKQYNWDIDPNSIIGPEGERRLDILKACGSTRLTIGTQSLDDGVLSIMGRPHNAEMALESIRNAKQWGFDLNIEFIFGHPGETFDNWIEVMDKAVTLPTDEIQLYRLKVLAYGDYQGKIIDSRSGGKNVIPDFRETMMMKQMALDILHENGYHENLRRVYSKQSKIFSHYAYNQCCNQYDQIGFGLTAFCSFRDRFTINTDSFEEYYARIDAGRVPANRGYIRDGEQQLRWAIVLPLKNRDVRKRDFERITGVPFDRVFRAKVARLIDHGLLEDTGATVRMTELGAFLADEVAEQFNSPEYVPFPRERYADGPLNPYLDNTIFA